MIFQSYVDLLEACETTWPSIRRARTVAVWGGSHHLQWRWQLPLGTWGGGGCFAGRLPPASCNTVASSRPISGPWLCFRWLNPWFAGPSFTRPDPLLLVVPSNCLGLGCMGIFWQDSGRMGVSILSSASFLSSVQFSHV